MLHPIETRLIARLTALGVAALSVLTVITASDARPRNKRSTPKNHGALIKVSTAKLRSGPGSSHKAVALLDEGRSARVIARDGQWAKVRLDSGKTGWVRRDLLDIAKKATRDTDAPRASEPDRRSSGRSFRSIASHKPTPATRRSQPKASVKVAVKEKAIEVDATPTPAPEPREIALNDRETLPVRTSDEPEPETPRDNISKARSALVGEALQFIEPDRSAARDGLISRAQSLRGTPYRFGATGNGSFDCSGFTQHVFRRQGIALPRTAAEQYRRGDTIARDGLEPGDLVFFRNTAGRSGISHVGMYIGEGNFIHASSHGGVRIDPLSKDYYTNHYAGARRVK